MLRIANMFNLVRKIANKKLRESIIAKINYSEKKKSIKIAFDMQKIMQRDNILSYY